MSAARGSAAATGSLRLRFGGPRKRESREAVLLGVAPRVDLPALVDVGDAHFVVELLVGEGRGVVLLEPVLDVEAVVGVAVGSDDGVIHHHALKPFNAMSFSSSGGSGRATRGELAELIVCG